MVVRVIPLESSPGEDLRVTVVQHLAVGAQAVSIDALGPRGDHQDLQIVRSTYIRLGGCTIVILSEVLKRPSTYCLSHVHKCKKVF